MLSWVNHENRANARNRILIKSVPDEGNRTKGVTGLKGHSGMACGRRNMKESPEVQTAHRLVYLEQRGRVKEKFRYGLRWSARDHVIDKGLGC